MASSSSTAAGPSTEPPGDAMDIDDDLNWETVKEQVPSKSTVPPRPKPTRRSPRKFKDLVPDINPSARASGPNPAPAARPPPAASATPRAPPPKPPLAVTPTNQFGIFKVWRRYPFASPPRADDGIVSDIPAFTKPDGGEGSAWWKGFGRLREGVLGASVDTVCGPLMNSSVFRLVRYYYETIHDRSVKGFNSFVRNVLKAKDFNIDNVPDDFDLRKECKKLDEHDDVGTPFVHSAAWHEATVRFPMSCEREKHASEERAPHLEVNQVLHRRLIEVIKSALQGPDSATYQYTPAQAYWKPGPGAADERIYSEVYNSDAFWYEHERVLDAEMAKPGRPDMPTAIIALQLYSDSTHLANFGSAALWPFYLYIGNQSKYERGKPTQYAAHHVAYIPLVRTLSFSMVARC